MPHYADGTEAKRGDHVQGKPYNTPHEVTGVVVGVIPGSEACNVRVAFARPRKPGDIRVVNISGYDPTGAEHNVAIDVDYGETKAFRKIT